ncbi:MAG: hypothetical protein WC890_07440 [Candidatus Margulisiibacteriota bacterium]
MSSLDQCTVILRPKGAYNGAFVGEMVTPEAIDTYENKLGATTEVEDTFIRLLVNSHLTTEYAVSSQQRPVSKEVVLAKAAEVKSKLTIFFVNPSANQLQFRSDISSDTFNQISSTTQRTRLLSLWKQSRAIIIEIQSIENAESLIDQLAGERAFSAITDSAALKKGLAELITTRRNVRLDYLLNFNAFSTGLNFPRERAEMMAKRGGIIFDRLEPWTPKEINGEDNLAESEFTLESIIEGTWDNRIKEWADGAIDFSNAHNGQIPVWASFAHEMNVESISRYRYPWAGDHEKYVAATIKVENVVRDRFRERNAINIVNWVWNPNIDFPRLQDYFPQGTVDLATIQSAAPEITDRLELFFEDPAKTTALKFKPNADEIIRAQVQDSNHREKLLSIFWDTVYVYWSAMDGYNTQDYIRANWRPFPLLFSNSLAQLSYFGFPMMIAEWGSDANNSSEQIRKERFLANAYSYLVMDERIKAESYFDFSKWEGGDNKDWEINTGGQIFAVQSAMRAHGYYFGESIINPADLTEQDSRHARKMTGACTEVRRFLVQKEDMTPTRLIKDRLAFLEVYLRDVVNMDLGNILDLEKKNIPSDKEKRLSTWLYQKEEMTGLVDGLSNNWFIFRDLGLPADPAAGNQDTRIATQEKVNAFVLSEEYSKTIKEKLAAAKNPIDLDVLKSAPTVPYLIDALNYSIGILMIRYLGEGEETKNAENVQWVEKYYKRRALAQLANISMVLAGELSVESNRQVLASLLDTYLETIIKNNAIHDRVLRLSISNLLLSIEEKDALSYADRNWLQTLEERDARGDTFTDADRDRLLQLVKTHYQKPIIDPLVAKLKDKNTVLIDKTTQLQILQVLEHMFVAPLEEVEKSLLEGNINDVIAALQKKNLSAPEKNWLDTLSQALNQRKTAAQAGAELEYLTGAEENRLYAMMDKYLPDDFPALIYPNASLLESSFFKNKSPLLYGKNLAQQGFIAKDFTEMSTDEVVHRYFDEAQRILEAALADPYTDQADIAEINQWLAKIILVKAGLEPDINTEFAMLGKAIGHIKETKVDIRHLQLHTQEIERMHAEALARQGFIRKEQKLEYASYFEAAKEKLAKIQTWGDEYKALLDGKDGRGTEEPLWAQQTIALAKLWTAKIRLVELGEEKQNPNESRTVTIKHQGEELVKLETFLTEATTGLETEPSLQADVWRSFGEQQVRLAYAKKDLGEATEDEIKVLVATATEALDKAIAQGVALTKSEGYYWRAKALLVQADYAITRDEELKFIRDAEKDIDAALALKDSTKEIKGRSLSALYAAKGEILMKQNQFMQAVDRLKQAITIYPKNYDAIISLADIYSWQREYDLAADSYKSITDDESVIIVPGKARFSDELALDQAKLGSYELALRQNRDYQALKTFAQQLLQSEAPASYLRKRATLALIELYSQRQDWYGNIFDLYKGLSPKLKMDRQFYYEVIRRTAEAHGGQRNFAKGRDLLKIIPQDYWREKTSLTDAELEMRGWRHSLPWMRSSMVTTVNNILKYRQDDPMLVAQALSDLYEAYATTKDFKGMIAIGDILLGKNFSPEARPKVQERFPLLNNNLLPKAFANFSDKALVVAQVQMKSKLADALIWERHHYAEAYQEVTAAQTYLDTTGSDLPTIEKSIYATDLLIKLGDIYRFGKKLKDPVESRINYGAAVTNILKLPQEWDDVALLLSRAYLGWAKLEQQESHPSLAHKYLVEAKRALQQIKLPPRSLDGEEFRAQQNILEQQLSVEYDSTTDNSGINENRITLGARTPFLRDWIAPAFTNYVDNTGTTRLSTGYAGAIIKPFGQRLGIEGHFKLPSTQYYLGQDTSSFPQYASYPDVSLSGTYYGKAIVATTSTEQYFDLAVRKQNTYYVKTQANIGGITQSPYLDLRIGPVFNQYQSNYQGNWQDHWFGGISADWGIDPAAFLRWVPFDLLRFGVDGTLPIAEYVSEQRNGQPVESNRNIFNGQAPYSGHVTGTINFGQYGKCSAAIGGTIQQAADYNYSRTETNISCTINSFGLYNLLNLGR